MYTHEITSHSNGEFEKSKIIYYIHPNKSLAMFMVKKIQQLLGKD